MSARIAPRHSPGLRPPGVHGVVGELEVGSQVAEQVEAERRRPEEICPRPLRVEALVRLLGRGGQPERSRVMGSGGQEGRTGGPRLVDGQAATDRQRRSSRRRHEGLRTDRVAVGLPPSGLV